MYIKCDHWESVCIHESDSQSQRQQSARISSDIQLHIIVLHIILELFQSQLGCELQW